jgi:putative phosphoesterase
MTKIGIISDTHDNQNAIKKALTIFNQEQVEYIFHCGDFIAPFSVKPFLESNLPVRLCFGNNDGEKVRIKQLATSQENCLLDEIILLEEINGKKIAMTHGHYPNVLDMALTSGRFDIVLSGHLHMKEIKKLSNGTLHINPGEGGGWTSSTPSLAILDLETLDNMFMEIKID